MGLLRLLLAFSVVAGHVQDFWHPFFFMNGSAAVVCFFVISGFYMALVLNEKYTDTASFLTARARRLYPAYYLFLLIVLAVALRGGGSFDPLAMLTSITLFGLDYFVIYTEKEIPIGPAWSIAVEFQFYLLAAVTFKTARGIVVVFLVGLLLRVLLPITGIVSTELDARLAVNNLVFFGAGGLSYLAYARIRRWPTATLVSLASGAAVVLLAVLFAAGGMRWTYGVRPEWQFYVVFLAIAALVPPLFVLTKDSTADRAFGELSYPIYLCHMFVYAITDRLQQGPWFFMVVLLGLSSLANLLLERPIQVFRKDFGTRLH